MELLILAGAETISFLLSRSFFPAGACFVLLFMAILLYRRECVKGKSLLDPRGIFLLSFTGGQGISCLRLSALQVPWEPLSWLCFTLSPAAFLLGYEAAEKLLSRKRTADIPEDTGNGSAAGPAGLPLRFENGKRIRTFVFLHTAVSWTAFLAEVLLIGYVPLFTTDMPHAYSYFHVSGLHYFTVSFVLVPSLMVLLLYCRDSYSGGRPVPGVWAAACCTASCILLPLLLVSRFQLIFSVVLAMITFLLAAPEERSFRSLLKSRAGRRLILAGLTAGAALFVGYIYLSIERAHSAAYLQGIFEMKGSVPIWITQPYMYIANNYDNFNCLVRDLPAHTHGLRMLFPVIALSGLKFLRPELAAFTLYITKEELTTLTIIYDAYYDFGIAGEILFCCMLGAAGAVLVRAADRASGKRKPFIYLILAQYVFYLAFSFFTTWYSNPATWFYYAVSVLMLLLGGGFCLK